MWMWSHWSADLLPAGIWPSGHWSADLLPAGITGPQAYNIVRRRLARRLWVISCWLNLNCWEDGEWSCFYYWWIWITSGPASYLQKRQPQGSSSPGAGLNGKGFSIAQWLRAVFGMRSGQHSVCVYLYIVCAYIYIYTFPMVFDKIRINENSI